MTNPIPTFYIYDHPDDYPRHFVVRRWDIRADNHVHMVEPVHLADTLDEARTLIPAGMVAMGDPNPNVVEVWMPRALADLMAHAVVPSGTPFVVHRGDSVTVEQVVNPQSRH